MNEFCITLARVSLLAISINAWSADHACLAITNHQVPEITAEWFEDSALSQAKEHRRLQKDVVSRGSNAIALREGFLFDTHVRKPGAGKVLHLTALSPDLPWTRDTATLTEITIELPSSAPVGSQFKLGEAGALIVFTAGFPGLADMCLGYAESGTVKINSRYSSNQDKKPAPIFSGLPDGDYLWVTVSAILRGMHGRTGERDACSRPCVLRLDMYYRKSAQGPPID